MRSHSIAGSVTAASLRALQSRYQKTGTKSSVPAIPLLALRVSEIL